MFPAMATPAASRNDSGDESGHDPRDERRALVCGLAAVLLWSTVATAFKLGLRVLAPAQLLAGATTVSLVALAVVLAAQGKLPLVARVSRRESTLAAGLGLLNPWAYYLILFEAYDRLPAQVAQPVNYTWALTLTYLSVPLRGHRLRMWISWRGWSATAG